MKITGTIKKVLPVRTGTSKKGSTWAAQQFVLKTDDGDILLEVFGQKEIDEYAVTEGEQLTVSYVPKVQEVGDKVFGKNSVTGIERDESQPFAE
ncbi:hypothetical protein PRBRB14_13360 [Hallella multisaccharivorax DSM 17128]|uniref:DUF3127 domain-containing protein n=1 Tax=Hallella multisaccharivorax DSM 17128 TaxID=688246 RepID=F8NBF9_9BACT|nr:DUF3127 domain-containing protein [Hallella multisaccharivorax]EGN56916.1 hypothetical protein Premu_1502 [Hallella multisaccharivorax DSM 17128]GJG30457.1 hypothetical protein PRBRB14_13360 [Hallella multisaccharivorax DSM 17128]